MSDGLIEAATQAATPTDRRIYGVAVAQVTDNLDLTGLGRVRLRFPWLPGVEPWARVAVLSAGADRGTYFIPQVGDEVLVAFNHGDIREPYVVGSLWNGQDRPPATMPNDPVDKRIIRTPRGHEVVFDDLMQSIKVTSSSGHEITIEPEKITVETDGGDVKVTLQTDGKVSLVASGELSVRAERISMEAGDINLRARSNLRIRAGSLCEVQASLVKLN
jgi:uncharacterized protein involved in type VI secretion and phage assembly